MFFCRDRGTLSAVSSHLFEVLASASLVARMRPSLPQRKLSRPPVGISAVASGFYDLGWLTMVDLTHVLCHLITSFGPLAWSNV